MNDSIFVRSNSILIKLNQEDIHFISADGNYCIINTLSGKKHAVKISLTAFAEKLNPVNFAQVHRGYIVQLDLINSIDTVGGVIDVNGEEIPLGRKFKDNLLTAKLTVV